MTELEQAAYEAWRNGPTMSERWSAVVAAVVAPVLKLHKVETGGLYCQEDGFRWPCATARAVGVARD